MTHRIHTPWKKSRTYGDIYGGRRRRRMTDKIFQREHSLTRPNDGQDVPILISENPSRDYYFPVSVEEMATALAALPESHRAGITHIWLRRLEGRPNHDSPLAEFVCGSGVRAIIVYPWRIDGRLALGRRRPQPAWARQFVRYGASIGRRRGIWYVQFSDANLRRYYIELLLCHEVGHHVDWYNRHWSKASWKPCEDAADQYAFAWGPIAADVISTAAGIHGNAPGV